MINIALFTGAIFVCASIVVNSFYACFCTSCVPRRLKHNFALAR